MHGGSLLEREEYVQISHSVSYIAMKILLHTTDLFLNCHCFEYIFFFFFTYFHSFFCSNQRRKIFWTNLTQVLYILREPVDYFANVFQGKKLTLLTTVSLVSIYIEYVTIFFLLTRSSITNSETKNLNFPEFFDQ